MLVGGIVIADQVDVFAGGYRLVDHAQKPHPLLMPVFLLAEAVDLTSGGVEGGEQGGGAVAFVVMRHGLAAPLFKRQSGLRAIQRLNLTFLIYRQHQRMLRWVEIEPDNGLQLICELGSLLTLKLS